MATTTTVITPENGCHHKYMPELLAVGKKWKPDNCLICTCKTAGKVAQCDIRHAKGCKTCIINEKEFTRCESADGSGCQPTYSNQTHTCYCVSLTVIVCDEIPPAMSTAVPTIPPPNADDHCPGNDIEGLRFDATPCDPEADKPCAHGFHCKPSAVNASLDVCCPRRNICPGNQRILLVNNGTVIPKCAGGSSKPCIKKKRYTCTHSGVEFIVCCDTRADCGANKEHPFGSKWSDKDRCNECECTLGGIIICTDTDECRECHYKGQAFNKTQTWFGGENNCSLCECVSKSYIPCKTPCEYGLKGNWSSWSGSCNQSKKTCHQRLRVRPCCKSSQQCHHIGIENQMCNDIACHTNGTKDMRGMRISESTSSIIGGRPVKPKFNFRWMVQIQILEGNKYKHHCGASILNNRFILTAAHCLCILESGCICDNGHVRNCSFLRARAGKHFVNEPESQTEQVSQFGEGFLNFTGFGFRFKTKCNIARCNISKVQYSQKDIAILELSTPFYYTDKVQPLLLPDKNDTFGDCLVIGWGATNGSGIVNKVSQSQVLLEAAVTTIDFSNHSVCSIEGVICAGNPSSDSCAGDSGGPFMCKITVQNGVRWAQIGIVMSGLGSKCGSDGGTYTDVLYHRDWILNTLKDASSPSARANIQQDPVESAPNNVGLHFWGNWTDWSECSNECGKRVRGRVCHGPRPAYGAHCTGPSAEEQNCTVD